MKKEILIIDYESSTLQLLGFILSKEYKLILKSSCYEALIWLEHRSNPDLILLDLKMPCFNGREFIKALKNSGFYRSIPIIVFADDDPRVLTDTPSYEIEGSIRKPFNPVYLRQKIENTLHHKYNNDE